jgi:hypothetical protein
MVGLVRAALLGLFAALGLVGFACGGPQEPAEEGADCYRDAECKYGLVCVPKPGGSGARTCSKQIGGLVSQVDRPPPPEPPEPPEDAGMMDDGGDPVDDGGDPVDDASMPMDDASMPMDDASMPMDDASMPMDDASMPMDDASMPMDDAGQ